MKVVVTGGAGFIGSHLVDRLVREGLGDVLVVDNLFRGRTENLTAHLRSGSIRFAEADVRDAGALAALFEGAGIVYHLAAQSNVMAAVADGDYAFTTNVAGTYNVLQAAHRCAVRRVIFASSREAYGEARVLPVDEDQPLGGKNPYGASKAAGEAYCRAFQSAFGLETAVLRLANVFGPRDHGRVIPLWMGQAARGEDLIVYGGQQVIDFVDIGLVVEALWRAATRAIAGQPINVGSGRGTPILHLAERILALSGSRSRLDLRPARAVEVTRFTARVDRMRALLGLDPPDDPLENLPKLWLDHFGAEPERQTSPART